MPDILGHPVEILALERCRCTQEGPMFDKPMCVLCLRPDPEVNLAEAILMFTPEQCVRIRDTLNEFLNDKTSWLYLPKAVQKELCFEQHHAPRKRRDTE